MQMGALTAKKERWAFGHQPYESPCWLSDNQEEGVGGRASKGRGNIEVISMEIIERRQERRIGMFRLARFSDRKH